MKVGRNDPCPCGSGKKYKKCCMGREEAVAERDGGLLEKINQLMQKGYSYAGKDELKEACDTWEETWKETLAWLGERKITNISKVNDLAGDKVLQFFSNWVQDFEMALEKIGSTDECYVQIRYDFTMQFRERFPNSSPTILLNMGTAAGESLFYLGRKEDADAQFEKVAKENPDNPWVWIRWGDMYTTWMNQATADHDRARELYEQALKVASDPEDQKDIQNRIEDLMA